MMTRKKRRSRQDRKGASPRQRGVGKSLYLVIPILAALLIGVGGGWLLARQRGTDEAMRQIQLAPVSQLPERVREAPLVVQEAYRFAIANPEILAKLPCYCGCGSEGHRSDLDCFIERFDPDGSIVFGYHAFE